MIETLDGDPYVPPQSSSQLEPEETPAAVETEDEHPQPQDMETSPSTPNPSTLEPKAAPPSSARKAGGKKRKLKSLSTKQRRVIEEKLVFLGANLKPKPFRQVPSLLHEVSQQERLFSLLGLWDFARFNFDQEIRKDLLAQLVANYDHQNRRSLVRKQRVNVSRADLARALALPVKKLNLVELEEGDRNLFSQPAGTGVLVRFLMNWFVLHVDDDLGIIPDEVQAAIGMIQDGQVQKVDWAGLLWTMVEKFLVEVLKTDGFCHYASHLQQLIRHQKPALFVEEEEALMEVPLPEVSMEEEEQDATADVDDGGAEKMEDLESSGPEKQQGTIFSFELGGDDKDDGEEKEEDDAEFEEAEQTHWCPNGNNEVAGLCLRRCNSNGVPNMDIDHIKKEEHVAEDMNRSEDDFTSKFPNLDSSADLLQGTDTGNISDPFCPSLQQALGTSTGEFLASRGHTHATMSFNYCRASTPLFGDSGKRVSSEAEDEEDDDDDIHHFSRGLPQKRLRNDTPWDHIPSEIDECLDQANNWMGKAKMLFVQKEQDIRNAQMQIQYLGNLVQQKDTIIASLERSRLEDQRKWQLEIHQFQHEHDVMSRMVLGYQKALRETRHAFADYRKQFPQGDEPVYKDVDGPGGAVLTAREMERRCREKLELERQRLVKRELDNQSIISMVLEFTREWSNKFETYWENVQKLAKRLDDAHHERKAIEVGIEAIAKDKLPEEPEGKEDNASLANIVVDTSTADGD